MRNKKLRALGTVILLLGTLASTPVFGLDVTPLFEEFGILFTELGQDTLPYAQQFGLTMDGTGRAEVGRSFFFSVSAGAVFLPGIATFRGGENPLTYFDLDTLIGGALGETGIGRTLYDGSVSFFLNPGLRLSMGLALANGIEFWGHFGIFPQPIATAVGAVVPLPGIVLNRFNAGGRFRFVLVKDQPSLPAVSLGVGYTHTQLNLGLEDLGAIALEGLEFSGFTVGMSGELYARTRLHTAGVELALSKKLAIFAPFLKLGAWYQWASYAAGITGLEISLDDGDPLTTNPTATGFLGETSISINDMSFVLAGGVEIVLGKFSLVLQGGYNTSAPAPSANLSLQFRI